MIPSYRLRAPPPSGSSGPASPGPERATKGPGVPARPRPLSSQPRLHRKPHPRLCRTSARTAGARASAAACSPAASPGARSPAQSPVLLSPASSQLGVGKVSSALGQHREARVRLTASGKWDSVTPVRWLRVSYLAFRFPCPIPFTLNSAPRALALRQRGRGRPGLREAFACSCTWVNTRVRARWA